MINVKIGNAMQFWEEVKAKQLAERFGIRVRQPTEQPYGTEVNIIDIAGVCWHFVE